MRAVPPGRRAAAPAVTASEAAAPLSAAEFAVLMAPLGPFENHPRLAVAVSGGADSLALCLLAHGWAAERGGAVVGLTVDHGLRAEAAAEAARVAGWLAACGIAHHVLRWRPPADLSNVQAAARAARYDLLFAWCRSAGCLHLLTAHHREDQAETLLLRLARGSGLDGLAGMAASREVVACRLLRPLLAVPRARLAASLRAADQGWIEDPSNRDPAYARARLRASAAVLAREGLNAARLAATARHLGRARAALEDGVTRLLAAAAWLHPAGFAILDPGSLTAAPAELALRVLARLVATVGGADHAPRLERLARLHDAVRAGLPAGRTLGGCRFVRRRGVVVVCREPAAVQPPLPALPGATLCWDDRFVVTLTPRAPGGLTVGALGAAGFGKRGATPSGPIPPAARATLPALRDLAGIVAVPHLDYVREDLGQVAVREIASVAFQPKWPLTAPGFTVV
jgi:tRNA(Ile)-lysidine synthase